MSGGPIIFGKEAKASNELCVRVEDQVEVWQEITRLGKVLGERLS